MLPEIYAGGKGKGADLAWWDMILDAEMHKLNTHPHAGLVMDIFKCFDKVIKLDAHSCMRP